jgi:hypothetical protein
MNPERKINRTDIIFRIIHSIPQLSRRLGDWRPERFDPEEFYLRTYPWSTTELLCVYFVLHVYDPNFLQEKGKFFNLSAAANMLYEAEREGHRELGAQPRQPQRLWGLAHRSKI